MTAEWVTAYATLGTLLVIFGTAVAALLQIRHMRSSNQIAALTEIRERVESPEFRTAESFVSYELPERYKHPEKFPEIFKVPFVGDYRAIGTVANFFENMGLLVKHRVIDATLACDVWSVVVLRNWAALAPMVTYARKEIGNDAIWENFEYLAVRCRQFSKKHPTVYPRGMDRMPEDRMLIDAVRD